MTGSVKDDMRNVGARLDGLQVRSATASLARRAAPQTARCTADPPLPLPAQEYIARRRDEAVRGGAQPGRPLPATAALGSGGPRAAAAPAPGEVDVLASIQGLSHSDAVVGQLKGQLLGQAASLKQLLQTRAESVQAQAGRRAQFGSVRDLGRPLDFASTAPSAGDVGAAAAAGAGGGSLGQPSRAPPRPAFGSAAPAANAGAGGDHDVISVGGANAFAQLSQAQLLPEAALVDARAADVAAIEQHINDLSTMFTRLASVVAEQGGLVERIEDNLESAHTNVEAGRTQLARHWERLSTNRALALRLGVVAVASVILFAVFGA